MQRDADEDLRSAKEELRALNHADSLVMIDTSPLQPLFRHYRGGFSWWYDVADVTRRLGLTCATLLFTHVNHFLLFSICVACFSLAAHTEMQPVGGHPCTPLLARHLHHATKSIKHSELNSLTSIMRWQTLTPPPPHSHVGNSMTDRARP